MLGLPLSHIAHLWAIIMMMCVKSELVRVQCVVVCICLSMCVSICRLGLPVPNVADGEGESAVRQSATQPVGGSQMC